MSGEQAEERTAREGRIDVDGLRRRLAERQEKPIAFALSVDRDMELLLSECSRLASRVEELEIALQTIAIWDFDFYGDCVAQAKNLAERVLAKHSSSLKSADSASNTESTRTAKETR